MFAKTVLQPETEEPDKCFLRYKTIHKHELKQSVCASGLKTLKIKPRYGIRLMFQRMMINTDSLLKLLKGLLGCRVTTVILMFMVAAVFHSRLKCDKKLKQYCWVTESPTEDQSITDSQNVSAGMFREKETLWGCGGETKTYCVLCATQKKLLIENHIMKVA